MVVPGSAFLKVCVCTSYIWSYSCNFPDRNTCQAGDSLSPKEEEVLQCSLSVSLLSSLYSWCRQHTKSWQLQHIPGLGIFNSIHEVGISHTYSLTLRPKGTPSHPPHALSFPSSPSSPTSLCPKLFSSLVYKATPGLPVSGDMKTIYTRKETP